jgi:hypothetical protein
MPRSFTAQIGLRVFARVADCCSLFCMTAWQINGSGGRFRLGFPAAFTDSHPNEAKSAMYEGLIEGRNLTNDWENAQIYTQLHRCGDHALMEINNWKSGREYGICDVARLPFDWKLGIGSVVSLSRQRSLLSICSRRMQMWSQGLNVSKAMLSTAVSGDQGPNWISGRGVDLERRLWFKLNKSSLEKGLLLDQSRNLWQIIRGKHYYWTIHSSFWVSTPAVWATTGDSLDLQSAGLPQDATR